MPTDDASQVTFAALLKRAATHGHRVPPEADLNPAVCDAINAVAAAWPRVPAILINKAQTAFARSELTRASAAKPTTPFNLNRPERTHRPGPADNH
ncbi:MULTISPECIES: hypothetical protein [Mycolicibacter]|uniref:Uncharacterized protein n=1 Tax=Mycolicibacter virginiensis TaxID=1795032 RepID=A0A9X7INW7_9MYCO|nr:MULTISPECIES: hypothetical protein [Mycobacteriaceae]OBG31666.1 hypothetical protein A5671_09070 [Mycolicibacter heraklionensis]OBJ33244.1 hypothetical protein A5631_07265 [Mycolicibacter heraklionensis]PQM52665.1 hypothetical protein C5U48_08640 [Mycolicibacter virginiensis]ULP45978.1 hypothetical protein MJO54_14020 [Mycolicibacter virginiensis]